MEGKYKAYPEYKDSDVEWLKSIPESWSVSKLKFAAKVNPSKSETSHLPRDTKISFLPMEAIGDKGELQLNKTRKIGEVRNGYTYLAENDVCIAKITPCFENGKGAILSGLKNQIGFATTEVIPLRPNKLTTPEFLYQLLTSPPFNMEAEGSMYGAGGQKRVADSFVENYIFALPPLPEQIQIARFLDHETGKIDLLIEKQQELIALLKEKRQAVISHAVTKGLNPQAPLKDSGIEWLGQVPKHWEVMRLKVLVSLKHGYAFDGNDFTDSGSHILTTPGNFDQEGGFKLKSSEKFFGGCSFPKDYLLKAGSIVVAMTEQGPGLLGCSAIIPENDRFLHNQRIGLIKIEQKKIILSDFLYHIFNSARYRAKVHITSTGAKVKHTSTERMLSIAIAVPPRQEQRDIAEHIQTTLYKIKQLEKHGHRTITLLQERRTALISAAVTGKIDVRDWKPPKTR